MKLIAFFILFVGAFGYKVETVSTMCFFVNAECHKYHTKLVEFAINKESGYISHSTTATTVGMHTMIVYKDDPVIQ